MDRFLGSFQQSLYALLDPISAKSLKDPKLSASLAFYNNACTQWATRPLADVPRLGALLVLLDVIVGTVGVGADAVAPRFAASYGNHMVLQQAPQRAVVWGYGSGAELRLDGQEVAVETGGEPGSWIAKLPATEGGAEPHTLVLLDNSTRHVIQAFDDILFGDVWVCSGQSNMAFLLDTRLRRGP